MNHIFVLPVRFMFGPTKQIIYPVVFRDGEELILVDCGYPGFMPKIEYEMNQIGLCLDQLTKIMITHHDYDHMGALCEIKDRYPSVEILCSTKEAPYITGQQKSLRLQQAEEMQDALPESEKEAGVVFQNFIVSVKTVAHVTGINGGDTLPWCGGIEVLDTKGHMPGHISLYVKNEKTLIAGDALVIENGRLCLAMPRFLLNGQDAQDSVRRLLDYEIEKIICYHGGIYAGDVKKGLQEAAEGIGPI